MRAEVMNIAEEVPATDLWEKQVLVFAPSNDHGLRHVKTLIHDLNREVPWIETEFRDSPNGDKVSDRFAAVLVHCGTSHSALTNIRKKAEAARVFCPTLTFTAGDLKAVLNRMAERRALAVEIKPVPRKVNGNGHTKSHPAADVLPVVVAQAPAETAPPVEPPAVTEVEPTKPDQPSNSGDLFKRFNALSEEVGMAVIAAEQSSVVLMERLEEAKTSLAEAEERLASIEQKHGQEMSALRKTSADQAAKITQLEAANAHMSSKLQRLQRLAQEVSA